MIIDRSVPDPHTRKDYDSDQEWFDYQEAVAVFRRSELIGFTGWTFDELDAQPRPEVSKLETFLRIKAGVQAEKAAMHR